MEVKLLILDSPEKKSFYINRVHLRNCKFSIEFCEKAKDFLAKQKSSLYTTAVIHSDKINDIDEILGIIEEFKLPIIIIYSVNFQEKNKLFSDTSDYKILLEGPVSFHAINSTLESLLRAHDISKEKLTIHEKSDAIGSLAGGIAHEFNNILATIMGYSEILMDELPENNIHLSAIQAILKASDKAKNLIKKMLLYSKRSNDTWENIHINELLINKIEEWQKMHSDSISINYSDSDKPLYIKGNQLHLIQIIENVFENSVKAMNKEKNVISVSLNSVTLEKYCKLMHLDKGDYARITIKDNGCGITPELLEKVFNPFYTSREPGDGIGLGLPIAQSIAKSSGGNILISETSTSGTSTEIMLPSAKIKKIESSKKSLNKKTSLRLLFVDDEENLVNISSRFLRKIGHEVIEETRGKKALETFEKNSQAIDLLITDIIMPDFNGVELIKSIRKINPELPVIVTTGYMDEHIVNDLNVNAILHKPLTFKSLEEKINEIFNIEERK